MRSLRASDLRPDPLVVLKTMKGEAAPRVAPASAGAIRFNQMAGTATPLGGGVKRLLDVLLVVVFLPLLVPLMLGLALLLKLSDRGPILYGHPRIGFGGREFRCLKFRTMVVDGDAVLRRHLDENPDQAFIWETERKLDDDPRVTRLGKVLRKLSLDELPQLLNVLKGEMSLVGPRPVTHEELALYGSAARSYLTTRPGLTGLWQISGRSDTTYDQRVRLDQAYVANWSLVQDLRIILMTVPVLVLRRGAR